jgi:hypothetical protein
VWSRQSPCPSLQSSIFNPRFVLGPVAQWLAQTTHNLPNDDPETQYLATADTKSMHVGVFTKQNDPDGLYGQSPFAVEIRDLALLSTRGKGTKVMVLADRHPHCRHRWKIERSNAWLQNFRRVLVRYDRIAENYLGRLHLACIILLLNAFLR